MLYCKPGLDSKPSLFDIHFAGLLSRGLTFERAYFNSAELFLRVYVLSRGLTIEAGLTIKYLRYIS